MNNPARRSSICLFLSSFKFSLICAQESKLQEVDSFIIRQTFGPNFDGFDFVPADGTRGGIIVAWRTDQLRVTTKHKGEFSITAEVCSLKDAKTWVVTSVYRPQETADKERFLLELADIGASMQLPWLINGDFNLVCDPSEKSNGRVNRRIMNKFRHTINSLALQDMPLQGRRYTWSNGQEEPILARLDCLIHSGKIYTLSAIWLLSVQISLTTARCSCPVLQLNPEVIGSDSKISGQNYRGSWKWCKELGPSLSVRAIPFASSIQNSHVQPKL